MTSRLLLSTSLTLSMTGTSVTMTYVSLLYSTTRPLFAVVVRVMVVSRICCPPLMSSFEFTRRALPTSRGTAGSGSVT